MAKWEYLSVSVVIGGKMQYAKPPHKSKRMFYIEITDSLGRNIRIQHGGTKNEGSEKEYNALKSEIDDMTFLNQYGEKRWELVSLKLHSTSAKSGSHSSSSTTYYLKREC